MKHLLFLFAISIAAAMLIPEEVEMVEGFGPMTYPEVNPEDDYFEARAMSEYALYNAIRNKRDTTYEVLESDGLRSHFRPNSVSAFKTIFASKQSKSQNENKRQKRSSDEKKSNDKSLDSSKSESKTSGVLSSQKSQPLASALVSKWTRTPFEYSKIQHEEDSMAIDPSQSANEGIKSRTPRVNFVTQQKKSLDNNDSKTSSTKPEFYKTPPLIRENKESSSSSSSSASSNNYNYLDRNIAGPSNSYPEYYHEREPERYMGRYDNRYMDDMMTYGSPPPHEPMPEYRDRYYDMPYDPYMPRMPVYPEQYYDYPDSRYDVPDYRDYPPVMNNNVDDRRYYPNDGSSHSRRRIIYYAHLPEIVRSPPTVDQRYRTYDRYDPYYDYYNPMMSSSYRKPLVESDRMHDQRDYQTSRPHPSKLDESKTGSTEKIEKPISRTQSYRSASDFNNRESGGTISRTGYY